VRPPGESAARLDVDRGVVDAVAVEDGEVRIGIE
jgi:hypothetical protein